MKTLSKEKEGTFKIDIYPLYISTLSYPLQYAMRHSNITA